MKIREWCRKHKVAIAIFFLAVVARLVLFSINFNVANGDFIKTIRGMDGYYEISRNLIEGNGYSFDIGPVFSPDPFRPPVWIFIMAFLAILFSLVLYLRKERITPPMLISVGIVAYFALMTTANGYGMNARFRVPVTVFVFAFAVYGLGTLYSFIKRSSLSHGA